MKEFIKGFFLNHFGNTNGKFEHSLKKLGFAFATYTAYILPHFLLYYKAIDGAAWVGFYQVIIPATLGIYAAGKWIDGTNNNGSKKK